ncbi:WXG100 family type VII secretion target [Nocardia panacis]|uniref:WXG100 family type VII secretion target n=1 Tax=Nocardia panacis TaxID=2340916 RepID=A0A3A4KRH2_9NOCA|nr:WXG100 family type VII secretion target [Nocardia panacis]RJO78717.1 WXG100 family type VII secretion target [Nocardia panacis]
MSNTGGSGLPSLSVVPDDAQAVGRFVYELAEAIRTALNSAGREVESLVNTGWTGTAAAQFGTGWGEIHDGGTQISSALTSMAEKLGITAETYRAQDTSSAQLLGTSGLDLPPL